MIHWRVVAIVMRRTLLVCALVGFWSVCANAQQPTGANDAHPPASAAEEFDAGVHHFETAEFAAAARAFLRADMISPNSEAISNAIVAARRANDHMLTAQAALRGIAFKDSDPGLAAEARQALAEASRHLARLDVGCDPEPCEVHVDGAEFDSKNPYLVPGTHEFVAVHPETKARTEQTQTLAAGTTYRIELHVTEPGGQERTADVVTLTTPADPAANDAGTEAGAGRRKPLPPAAVYAGAGVTAVLAGVTIWSGVNTLNAKDDLPAQPTTAEVDAVQRKALRTDLLLAGSIVTAGVTAAMGLLWVDWNPDALSASVSPIESGAVLLTTGRF